MPTKSAILLPALLGLSASCSGFTSQRAPEDPGRLLKAVGEGPSVEVVLSQGATERQQRTCKESIARFGVATQADAEVSAALDITSPESKTLTVTSKKKGQVLKEERPAWYLEDLCADALAAALRAWGTEKGRKVPPPPPIQTEQAAADDNSDRPRRRRARKEGQQVPAADAAAPAPKKGEQDPWGKL